MNIALSMRCGANVPMRSMVSKRPPIRDNVTDKEIIRCSRSRLLFKLGIELPPFRHPYSCLLLILLHVVKRTLQVDSASRISLIMDLGDLGGVCLHQSLDGLNKPRSPCCFE